MTGLHSFTPSRHSHRSVLDNVVFNDWHSYQKPVCKVARRLEWDARMKNMSDSFYLMHIHFMNLNLKGNNFF